jgi:hypothetical protein
LPGVAGRASGNLGKALAALLLECGGSLREGSGGRT